MDGDRHVALEELLIGTEGLALLRNLYDGSDARAAGGMGPGVRGAAGVLVLGAEKLTNP